MADYGLKYQCTFDPIAPLSATPVYKIEILQKEYTGTATSVTGAGVPALHQRQTDDPKAPVQGSSLSFSLINRGALPMGTFYSVEDDTFKVRFWYGTQLLFEGFIVQDDCSEPLVDFTHEINLSATDNLGLLKSIALDKSPTNYEQVFRISDSYSTVAPHTLILSPTLAAQVLNGDKLNIAGLIFNITYTIVDNSGITSVVIEETVSTSPSPVSGDIRVLRSSLLEKITLLTVIKTCLVATGLQLNTFIWGKINEVSQDITRCFFEQTLIDPQTFINGSQEVVLPVGNLTELNYQQLYDDCYTVLEKVLGRFNMCVFQAKGAWQIMRWDELRYYTNAVLGYQYDSDFNYIGEVTMDAPVVCGAGELIFPETGLLRKYFRPFASDLETFNFKQPALLLRNYDLQTLGPLLKSYEVTIWITLDGVIHYSDPGLGGGPGVITTFETWNEYSAPWWYYENAFPSVAGVNGAAEYFIRIIYDNIGQEIDRYLVIKHNHIHSYKVEANRYDLFKWSFSLRTPDKDWTDAHFVLIIKLTNGTTTLYAKAPLDAGQTVAGWGPGLGFGVDILGDTKNYFYAVSIQSQGIPFDGLLTFYLQTQAEHAADETQYKDIRLEYIPLINQSSRITGQTHKTFQSALIKQNSKEEIFIDSSPRNSIAGTLFLQEMEGLLQKKTSRWQHPYLPQNKTLGDLITWEQMYWRRKPRTILEGSFTGLVSGTHISPLTVFKFTGFPNLNFVLGRVEIDYKNNKFSGTLWEIWEGTGVTCQVYTFAASGFPVGAWSISGMACDGSLFNYSSISGTGEIPTDPICARTGSITTAGSITVTAGESCGGSGEIDGDFDSTYQFNYLYAAL